MSKLFFEGSKELLTLTYNAQPSIFAVSMAVISVLRSEVDFEPKNKVKFLAGHSLGEYSALATSESLSIAQGAQLLRLRGLAMQNSSKGNPGAMTAILGGDYNAIEVITTTAADLTGGVCVIANDNAPGQIVISGTVLAVEKAEEIAKKNPEIKRIVRLGVSGGFHSPLMSSASEELSDALFKVELSRPNLPLISNVNASPVNEPNRIIELLIKQMTERVRWRESINYLTENGIDEVIEIGSGKVLSGLSKRINPELKVGSIETPEDIDAFLASH